MTHTAPSAPAAPTVDALGWPVAGTLLDAFTRRDFETMAACLSPQVRFRALIPPGAVDVTGPAAAIAKFEQWFGAHDQFDVIDASVGQVGPRLYIRWRIATAANDDPDSARVIEQQLYATASDRIDVLDLMCSGFQVPA